MVPWWLPVDLPNILVTIDCFETWLVLIERSFQGLLGAIETMGIIKDLMEIWLNEVCDIARQNIKKTQLTAWFDYNSAHDDGLGLTYWQFPQHYTWNAKVKSWHPRRRAKVIGSVTNFIRPYLHQFSIDSHGLNGYGKPLKRPFDRYQSLLEAISNGRDIRQINW